MNKYTKKRAQIKQNRGFSLIEIMIVILIVGIIVSIMLPNIKRAYYRSKLAACQSNLRNIATLLQIYIGENGKYPDKLTDLSPDYIRTLPTCPQAEKNSYTDGYQAASNPDNFTIQCQGNNHSQIGLDENQPRYNLNTGLEP